MQRVFQRIARR
ncbi:hypothetical protein D030_3020A, partial [Vibrio parahaemolyticus AQ3810]